MIYIEQNAVKRPSRFTEQMMLGDKPLNFMLIILSALALFTPVFSAYVLGVVMMAIMATTAAARLPLQPLMVRRAAIAPRGIPVRACGIRVRAQGYCKYFIVP